MRALPDRSLILVPVLLAAQAWIVQSLSSRERPPAAPDLSTIPAQIGGWTEVRDDPVDADVARELHADRLLNRIYGDNQNSLFANLFVAWFESQRGAAQPHSPIVCLPGAGWIIESSSRLGLATRAGWLRANRLLISHGSQRAIVLYWYQNPRRTVGEWEAKLAVIIDAVRYRRTDIEIVRVVVWQNGTEAQTSGEATAFASEAYPLLLRYAR